MSFKLSFFTLYYSAWSSHELSEVEHKTDDYSHLADGITEAKMDYIICPMPGSRFSQSRIGILGS